MVQECIEGNNEQAWIVENIGGEYVLRASSTNQVVTKIISDETMLHSPIEGHHVSHFDLSLMELGQIIQKS